MKMKDFHPGVDSGTESSTTHVSREKTDVEIISSPRLRYDSPLSSSACSAAFMSPDSPGLFQRKTNPKLLSTLSLLPRESDPSKAVVVYQPRDLPVFTPGRSLTGNQAEKKEKSTKSIGNPQNAKPRIAWKTLVISAVLLVYLVQVSRPRRPAECVIKNSTSYFDFDVIKTNVYGQELAISMLQNTLQDFMRHEDRLAVFLLIGGPGTGKTFTSNLLYNTGSNEILKRKIFLPLLKNQESLNPDKPDSACCDTELLIVDDTDMAETWQLNLLSEFLRILQHSPRCRKAVVVINSSAGQKQLTRILFERLQSNQSRNLSIPNLTEIFVKTSNSALGETLVKSSLNFSVIPFLPLEKEHVRLCAERQMKLREVKPTAGLVERVLSFVRFHPAGTESFAVFGCKNIHTYVNLASSKDVQLE